MQRRLDPARVREYTAYDMDEHEDARGARATRDAVLAGALAILLVVVLTLLRALGFLRPITVPLMRPGFRLAGMMGLSLHDAGAVVIILSDILIYAVVIFVLLRIVKVFRKRA